MCDAVAWGPGPDVRCRSNNQITTRGTQAIIALLRVNTTLCDLQLSDNKIGDAGAVELARVIAACGSLTRLDLCRNKCALQFGEYRGLGWGGVVPSPIRCGEVCGSPGFCVGDFAAAPRNVVVYGALRARRSLATGVNVAEDPGFCVGNCAANSKREISRTKLTAPEIPPLPPASSAVAGAPTKNVAFRAISDRERWGTARASLSQSGVLPLRGLRGA